MSSKTYFITGATGFIGLTLCKLLRQNNHKVYGVTRKSHHTSLEKMGVNLLQCDLNAPSTYSEQLSEASHIIHLAGNPTFGNGDHYIKENLEPLKALISAAETHSSKSTRFLFISSIGAIDRIKKDPCNSPLYEDSPQAPSSDYGRSKLEGEKMIQNSSLNWSIIRPSLVVGPSMRYLSHLSTFSQIANSWNPLSFFNLNGRYSMIHVDDLCNAIIKVAESEKSNREIFFAAGNPFSLGEIFQSANPKRRRFKIPSLPSFIKTALPFKLKSLISDALVASDKKLQETVSWHPQHKGKDVIASTVQRERARKDPLITPPGYTVVTGAASGLGKAFAEKLHLLGRKLILIDRDEQKLLSGVEGKHIVCDLSNQKEIEKLLNEDFWFSEGGVSELFACAGIGARGLFWEKPRMEQEKVFTVNLLSRYHLLHHTLECMAQKYFGRIVLISSSSAFQPLPYMSAYAASNAALLSLGEGIAGELEKCSGIEMVTVCPGGMQTNFQRTAGVKELSNESLLSPEEMAEKVLKSLGKGSRTLIYPARSKSMALLARALPRKVSVQLWKKLMGGLR